MHLYLLPLSAAIGCILAQSLEDLPECGQTCIANMISVATSELGCANGNVTCYCTVSDFGYGVRDCANQACPTEEESSESISFGISYCANAIQAYSSTVSGGATSSSTASQSTSSSINLSEASAAASSLVESFYGTSSVTQATSAVSGGGTTTPARNQASSSLSTGAKAGIGVGAVAGVGALVGLGRLLFILGRRKGRELETGGKGRHTPALLGKRIPNLVKKRSRPESSGEDSGRPEIDGTTRHELHHPEAELPPGGKSEMAAAHGRSELYGSQVTDTARTVSQGPK